MQMVRLMHPSKISVIQRQKGLQSYQLVVQPMDYIHINVHLPALDFVLSEMKSHFDDNMMPVVRQMMTFSDGNLLSKPVVICYQMMWTCFATDIILTLN